MQKLNPQEARIFQEICDICVSRGYDKNILTALLMLREVERRTGSRNFPTENCVDGYYVVDREDVNTYIGRGRNYRAAIRDLERKGPKILHTLTVESYGGLRDHIPLGDFLYIVEAGYNLAFNTDFRNKMEKIYKDEIVPNVICLLRFN